MDWATQLEDSFEIIVYVVKQISLPDLSSYYPYMIIAGSVLFFIIVVTRIFASKRAVKEYIENPVCLKVTVPPMADDKKGIIKSVVTRLYDTLYLEHKSKYSFSIEIILKQDHSTLFFIIPESVYSLITPAIWGKCTTGIVTKYREDFLNALDKNILGADFELINDFVFPTDLRNGKNININEVFDKNDWIMLQLVLRPAGERWQKVIDKYLQNLSKGRDSLQTFSGCLGGCLGVTFPVFEIIANTMTSLIHGSQKEEKVTEGKDVQISEDIKKKQALVTYKREQYGFEINMRVLVHSLEEEKRYVILEKLLNMLKSDQKFENSLIIKTTQEKYNQHFVDDIVLSNISKQTLDLLNSNEVVELISLFL